MPSAGDPDRSRVDGVGAEHGPGELGLARPDQSGHPDDLAGVDVQVDVA
jgi:hypothetical protein